MKQTLVPLNQVELEERWKIVQQALDRQMILEAAVKEHATALDQIAVIETKKKVVPDQANIDRIAHRIYHWANEAFPDRQDASMFIKMYQELGELSAAGDDPDKVGPEVADILIMVLDYAIRKGVNIHAAVENKMHLNRQRAWIRDPLGFYKHVK